MLSFIMKICKYNLKDVSFENVCQDDLNILKKKERGVLKKKL